MKIRFVALALSEWTQWAAWLCDVFFFRCDCASGGVDTNETPMKAAWEASIWTDWLMMRLHFTIKHTLWVIVTGLVTQHGAFAGGVGAGGVAGFVAAGDQVAFRHVKCKC